MFLTHLQAFVMHKSKLIKPLDIGQAVGLYTYSVAHVKNNERRKLKLLGVKKIHNKAQFILEILF